MIYLELAVMKFYRDDSTNRRYVTQPRRYLLTYDGKTWTIEINHKLGMGIPRHILADGFRTRRDAVEWFEIESLKGIQP